jgi:glutathione peroxidase
MPNTLFGLSIDQLFKLKKIIMNKLIILLLIGFTSCFNAQEIKQRPISGGKNSALVTFTKENEAMANTFFDFKMRSIDGEEVSLAQFKGKKIVILNTASKCGFTPQYEDWEKFYKANKDKVVVLGFPCNQFMGQEAGDNAEIKSFCQKNYGVSFPMFEKIDVKGDKKAPLYAWLSDKSQNGWNDQTPSWNFCKYLINEKGELTNFFASKIKPDNAAFLAAIK